MYKKWTELQEAQKIWQSKNFPNTKRYECLLGMGEEFLYEYIRDRTQEQKKDAIADTMIFMLGYCNSNGIDFSKNVLLHDQSFNGHFPFYYGKLCQAHLKMEQGIRKSTIDYETCTLTALCGMYSMLRRSLSILDPNADIFELTEKVFRENVEIRNWNKDKK